MENEALHHTVFMLDAQNSGARTNPEKLALREVLHSVVEQALRFALIDDGFRLEDRGDGVLGTLTAAVPKVRLVGAAVEGLVRALATTPADPPVRLRLGMHSGEVHRDPWGIAGSDVDHACRLADAPVAKRTLEAAPAARLVVVVSEPIYDSVVRHGGPYLRPETYQRVRVRVKEVDRDAWLHLPGYTSPPVVEIPDGGGDARAEAPQPTRSDGRRMTVYGPAAHIEHSQVRDVHVGHVYRMDER